MTARSSGISVSETFFFKEISPDLKKNINYYFCYYKKTLEASQPQGFHFLFVGVRRLELPTPCTPCKYASQLRHTPNLPDRSPV
jgi:hypothetical protein